MSVDIQRRNCGLALQQEFAPAEWDLGMQQTRRPEILLELKAADRGVPD
jgi:hypothetical protein